MKERQKERKRERRKGGRKTMMIIEIDLEDWTCV
jgi:hypothetical protein